MARFDGLLVEVDVPDPYDLTAGGSNGALDIFVKPGPGTPAVKLQVRGEFNGWVDLSPIEAIGVAQALIRAATSLASEHLVTFDAQENPGFRGQPASGNRGIPRLDASAASGVDDVSGRVDGHAKGRGRSPKRLRVEGGNA